MKLLKEYESAIDKAKRAAIFVSKKILSAKNLNDIHQILAHSSSQLPMVLLQEEVLKAFKIYLKRTPVSLNDLQYAKAIKQLNIHPIYLRKIFESIREDIKYKLKKQQLKKINKEEILQMLQDVFGNDQSISRTIDHLFSFYGI